MTNTDKIKEKVFDKYSWSIQGKGKPHEIHGHNIDLAKAIDETLKQRDAEILKKIDKCACGRNDREWINVKELKQSLFGKTEETK